MTGTMPAVWDRNKRALAASMQTAPQLQATTAQFMANSVRPSGALTSEQRISPDNAERFKQEWQATYSAEGKGKVAVLHSGLEFKPLSLLTGEDLQIIAHREFSVQDVARIFAVPLFVLGDATRATCASARESSRQFAMQALAPWVYAIAVEGDHPGDIEFLDRMRWLPPLLVELDRSTALDG
jgi:HK97 family phage portal protein